MRFSWKPWGVSPMRDLSGTGQVYRFTLSQLLKSRANRVTLIIMVLLAAVSMPLTALLGGETPETSDTAGLTSVRVDNRTDLVLDFSGDAYWADTDFSADAGEPDAVVTITGDETGYQVAVNGGETADAGELSQLAETARQAVRDACLQAAGLSSRQLEALTASTGEEDSHEEGFWVQYGYSILAMILCLMSASYVIRAVVEEKDSRLVELLLVSVKPMALLAGKILAVMAFTFGWLLAMLAGLGVSCGLTAGLMGPGVLQKQLSGLLAAVPRVQEDLWQAAGVLLVLLVSLGLGYLTMSLIGGVAGACCSGMAGVAPQPRAGGGGGGGLRGLGGAGRAPGACDAADHGRVSGLLRGGDRALRAGGGVFHPVPRCEYFLRPGAVCRGQCVLLAGAGVLGDPGGGDLGSADPGVPGICGTHRPPGQPGEAA